VGARDVLAGLRGPEETDDDWDDRLLSFWRPFPCPDQGAGAASASGPVDEVLVHALAVLRVFDTDWGCPAAGRCELVPLAEVVVVGRRSPGGDWAVSGGASCHDDAAAGRMLAAPRTSPGLTNWGRSGADAWALLCTVISPLADGTEVDPALVLAAADCWRVAGLLLLVVVLPAVLGPPTLRASSSPSTLFEPVTDRPLGRLTLGGALSPSSHKDPPSAQPSAPAAPSCGEKGGGGLLSEPAGESVREFSQARC
jgi:hypothetical protein